MPPPAGRLLGRQRLDLIEAQATSLATLLTTRLPPPLVASLVKNLERKIPSSFGCDDLNKRQFIVRLPKTVFRIKADI